MHEVEVFINPAADALTFIQAKLQEKPSQKISLYILTCTKLSVSHLQLLTYTVYTHTHTHLERENKCLNIHNIYK